MSDQTPYSQYPGNPYSDSGTPFNRADPQQQSQVPIQPQPGYTPQQYYPPGQQPPMYSPPVNPYAPYPYPAVGVVAPQSEPGSGLAIAGLILGIISIPSFFIFYVSIPVAIIGIVLSALGRRSVSRRKMATWGLALSIIGLFLAVAFIVLIVLLAVTHQPTTPQPTTP
jgi:hypothetical protein